MHQPPAFTQNTLREGIVELAFGEPDPSLLPVEQVREAAANALGARGAAAISYGSRHGPQPLRNAIAARISARDGIAVTADEILVTGGNSQALEQVLTMLTRPGDVVLVESPTYNLALGIIRDHPVEIVAVPLDDDGLDVEALAVILRELRSAGRRVPLLYTIPTFHNPAGVCLSAPRRKLLTSLANEHDLVLVEDDVYRELAFEGVAPAALRACDPQAPIVRLGSFSKSLAPGLRLGWIDAPPGLLGLLADAGMLESGGCVSQFSAHVVAALLAGEGYDEHVSDLCRTYASRRDALAAALRAHLPAACRFSLPAGGFFLWVALPPGLAATALLPIAEQHGVAFAPGARFCSDGADCSLRLAFCLYDEASLVDGARRLGDAVTRAVIAGV